MKLRVLLSLLIEPVMCAEPRLEANANGRPGAEPRSFLQGSPLQRRLSWEALDSPPGINLLLEANGLKGEFIGRWPCFSRRSFHLSCPFP